MRTTKLEKLGWVGLVAEIHGKINRKSSNVFKTSTKYPNRFFEYCYDPEKPERKTYRRWKNRQNLAYATKLAKLDYNNYPAERAKFEEQFKNQDKYTKLFYFIVACHKLALDRADAITFKLSGSAMDGLRVFLLMESCNPRMCQKHLSPSSPSSLTHIPIPPT